MVQVHTIKTPVNLEDSHYPAWCRSLLPESVEFKQELWDSATLLLSAIDSKAKNDEDLQPTITRLFVQSFEMANILSTLKVSNSTLIATMLYPFVDAKLLSVELVAEKCARRISEQLKGVLSMDAIRSLQANNSHLQDESHIDNLRKMLLVMVDDVRVVLIKLAERLYLLRQAAQNKVDAAFEPEKRQQIAQEISDVYAPLANRLGVGQIKWEMEDLAFRILKKDQYSQIAKSLDERRADREAYVNQVLQRIRLELDKLNVKADLQGRAKHIYSIWKKMQRKHVGFEEIYDVRAVRILVSNLHDCYLALGVVHGLWKHIPKEFDDYIATPKENGYRSLHTAVVGDEGKTLEIQIRTFDMHQESELGVAAHWKYKEGKGAPTDGYEAKIAWLRQLLEWQDEVTDSADLIEEFRNQVVEERVYVFTPLGKLIDLPKGATPLDFAYRVHTEVGHRCRGAKVNGRIVPLTCSLETGQKVEILTAKLGGPSRDWLNEHSGYIRSSRARSKVQQWFRQQNKDKNASAGKHMIERELQKHNLKFHDFSLLAKHFNYNRDDELFAAIGIGDKGLQQVYNAILSLQKAQQPKPKTPVTHKSKLAKRSASSDILVEGVGNLLTRMANCCKPVPGDEIAGYVSLSRGIMVHRSDCRHLIAASEESPEKILNVEWSGALNERYRIDLLVKAYDRTGLLKDVTGLMSDEKVSMTKFNTDKNKAGSVVSMKIQIEVPGLDVVSRIMSRIEQLPSIISVQRK